MGWAICYTFWGSLYAVMNFPNIIIKTVAASRILVKLIALSKAFVKYTLYTIEPKTWVPTNPQTIPHCAGEKSEERKSFCKYSLNKTIEKMKQVIAARYEKTRTKNEIVFVLKA